MNIGDEIKVDGVGGYAGNDESFISDDASRWDEGALYKSYMKNGNHFDFIVNMLCSNEVCCGAEDKETKLREVRGHLTTQKTEVKFHTESVGIRAISIHDFRNKVNESDNLGHEQKGNVFRVLSKYWAHFTSKPALCIFEYEF